MKGDGIFTIKGGLFADEYWCRFYGLTTGFYVKEAWQAGSDILKSPVRTGSGDIRVILAEDASITAVVGSPGAPPVHNALVLLMQADLPPQYRPDAVVIRSTDQNGTSIFTGVAPGKYRIVAIPDTDSERAGDWEYVQAIAAKATNIQAETNARLSVTLQVQ